MTDLPPDPILEAAYAANAQACAHIDGRRFVEAIEPAEEAARLAPTWSAAWSNLTVAYKHAHRWAARHANARRT